MLNDMTRGAQCVSRIVHDAGGRLVGRTRLQKVGYLLEVMGYGDGFAYFYKHYGPYSEQLTSSAQIATALNFLKEEEHQASWGGKYSVFLSIKNFDDEPPSQRQAIIDFANKADALELELAATAILLSREGYVDPWAETASRKPAKCQGDTLNRAKEFFSQLKELDEKKCLADL